MAKIVLTSVLLLFFQSGLLAQRNIIRFKHLTADEGLSQSTVHCILKDRDGFVWVGTHDGLNRYDGYEFKIYKHDRSDSTTIIDNSVLCALEDSAGNLWFGTQTGLSCYSKDRNAFINYIHDNENPDGLSTGSIQALQEGTDGRIWIGTSAQGLDLLEPETGKFTHFRPRQNNPEAISNGNVESILKDSKGNLWVGTNQGGLSLLKPTEKTFRSWRHNPDDPESIPSDRVEAVVEDRLGHIWICTYGAGICKLLKVGDDYQFIQYQHQPENPSSLSNNLVLSMIATQYGLWIGTENSGLDFFDFKSEEFTHLRNQKSNPGSLNNDSVYTLLKDETGTLWVGTYAGGLNLASMTNQAIKHYCRDAEDPASLSSNSVMEFSESYDGTIWIATDGGGLNHFDRKTQKFEHYDVDNSNLKNNAALCVLEDSRRDVWVGTWASGLCRFNRNSQHFQIYLPENSGLPTDKIFALFEDSKGRFWLNSFFGGLVLFDRDKGVVKKLYSSENSLILSNHFKFIIEDNQGNLIFGSELGLNIFDPESETVEAIQPANHDLSHDIAICALAQGSSILWIGTQSGLNRFDRSKKQMRHYFEKDGLPNNAIRAILMDDDGIIWLATNMGMSRFDPRSETFRNFGKADGLQGNEFNSRAGFKSRDGHLWFGGVNGFNVFDPHDVIQNRSIPPVVLTDFQVFNKPVPLGNPDSPLQKHVSQAKAIRLSHQQSVFSFAFAALDFTAPEKNQYAYKLEGFDENWNHVGHKRTATYTNIDPGEYVFRVKGSNNDGYWNEEGRSIRITITPPFWEKLWFRIGATVFLLGLIIAIYRLRVRSIEAQNRKLEQLVEERTGQLRGKNEKLTKTLDELQKTRQQLIASAHKAGMANIAVGIIHRVGNILNSITTSVFMMQDRLSKSSIKKLSKANNLLRRNLERIEDFIMNDPKGRKLLDYFLVIEDHWKFENNGLEEDIARLSELAAVITRVVAKQHEYAGAQFLVENLTIDELIEESLSIQETNFEQNRVTVKKHTLQGAEIIADSAKTIDVLNEILTNAVDAMQNTTPELRKILIETAESPGSIQVKITDTGCGIVSENRHKIFQDGFSTKTGGAGEGLHNCANFMTEMSGRIGVESLGEGKGSTFILEFACPEEAGGRAVDAVTAPSEFDASSVST